MHTGGPADAAAGFGELLLEVEDALAANGAEGGDLRIEISLHGKQPKAIGDLPVDREIAGLGDRGAAAHKCERYPDAKGSDGTTNPRWTHITFLSLAPLAAELLASQEQL